MGWDKLKQMGSQNDDQTEEEKEVVLLSAENTEIRGKDIDLKQFEEGNPGQSDPKDNDLYNEFRETFKCKPF